MGSDQVRKRAMVHGQHQSQREAATSLKRWTEYLGYLFHIRQQCAGLMLNIPLCAYTNGGYENFTFIDINDMNIGKLKLARKH